MIRVQLPAHLRSLAGVGREVEVDVAAPVTPAAIIGALEAGFPALRGTIRDHTTHKRRAMVRYFVCERDISHDSDDTPVPDIVANGSEPFLIIGAISGGGDDPIAIPRISGPANAALEAVGIASLQDVARHSRKQIADLHGMGPKGLRILDEALAGRGLFYEDRAAVPGEYTSS